MAVSGDITQVPPHKLREWAIAHDQAAEACVTARQGHERTLAAARSWGPLFHQARRATVDAVNAREAALKHEEQRHRAMADQLRAGATTMEETEAVRAASLTIRTD
jgi:hypothetical protein